MTLKSVIFAIGLALTPLHWAVAQTPDTERVSSAERAVQADTLHEDWSALLARYVEPDTSGINLVDYARLKANTSDRAALADYVEALAGLPLSALPANDQFAAWANLYNALTVQIIVENYPVDSIRDIKSGLFSAGPWKRELVRVEGDMLSLDNIEHDILRVRYDDPRVHYAVNCASLGCPNLRVSAWKGATLDQDLDEAARDYINNPRGVFFRHDGKLDVSKIYDWYKEDFGGSRTGILDHLRAYIVPERQSSLVKDAEIRKFVYDWALNDVSAGRDQ
ncbi:MAG: DUF547 domain-containing protein [Ponticaulis sp.]|nr:DUF547 domain-containing protein [Ponticaulis sp.]|tara:strand:- start:35365 stop:36201 length:837 start_codon:yes stop_codon:yes gene_type:complete